ncbi:polysaccharide biosynthesis/export family protein [Neisseria chenwenguii]|uniref:Sugar ABC transporter substrate-binding protein n=1 Tax=Neisseria chenwenguii TaxID=1853278 RepID=A0A220S295_9NEIS|nr:polysaccharide biosynthesis/export family protein [Neisseria chenwenguii]ASK27542.1 sugar ABC transporter substrate-binding protein [Neisseria chenwenguii]ROV55620.1 polysaccharide export protein [Neisseria chenwenguii]
MPSILFKRHIILTALSALAVAACGSIPTSGPSGKKVVALGQQRGGVKVPDVAVVDVDDAVARSLYQQRLKQSFADLGEGYASAGAVNVGDVLDITVWEAAPAVLFGGALSSVGSGSAQSVKLPEQMVSAKGTVSVPFIGNVAVAGKTPVQIQEIIRGRLKRMANQPQVMVRLSQNNAANVSVIRAGNSVRMPLTQAGERVLDAVAAVGGSTANVQDTNVQLTRGNAVKTVALEDLVANPRQNILLRRGDVVTMITNPSTFTAMGAVGKTEQIGFSVKGLSLAEAVGRMGGLQDRRADARGVFVFRYAPLPELPRSEQSRWAANGYSADAEIPVVYRVNMQDANSLFWMQRFPVKNKDIVYVSNAPLAETQKFLQFIFSPVVSSVNSVNNIAN